MNKEISLKELLETSFYANKNGELVGEFTLTRINQIANVITYLNEDVRTGKEINEELEKENEKLNNQVKRIRKNLEKLFDEVLYEKIYKEKEKLRKDYNMDILELREKFIVGMLNGDD